MMKSVLALIVLFTAQMGLSDVVRPPEKADHSTVQCVQVGSDRAGNPLTSEVDAWLKRQEGRDDANTQSLSVTAQAHGKYLVCRLVKPQN